MILAIDTATRLASVALYSEAGVVSELTWHSHDNHTVELMPNVDRILKQQGLEPLQLEGVTVALGPGSFTGLRIGMSVAKGLAFAGGVPLVAVPTLEIVAYPHLHHPYPICAIIQAGRGRICTATYEADRGQLRQRRGAQITTMKELTQEIRNTTFFCGEIRPGDAKLLRDRLGEQALLASAANSLRRSGYLAELGWQRLNRGETADPATLAPLYLHHPDID